MDQTEIDRMHRMEDSYWWHTGRRHVIRRVVSSHLGAEKGLEILDVGCGTGRNLDLLGPWGRTTGVEPPGAGLDRCRAQGLGEDRVKSGTATALPFPDASFDLLTAFDVLEHVEDDRAALSEFRRVLRPGGHVLLTVPAYRFMWSVHDEALGHRRRYVASEVHALLNNAGFTTVRRSYAITLALPGIAAFRVLQGLFPALYARGASYVEVPAPVNRALAGLLWLESVALRSVDLPVGTTVVALARKWMK